VVSDERAEKALRYLAVTDEPAAEAKAEVERSEFKAKSTKAAVFLHEEGTVAEREAKAMAHKTVGEAYTAHFKAIRDYQAMANKRELEKLVLEVWRSVNSNRRAGMV
jgi:hypothetical protein